MQPIQTISYNVYYFNTCQLFVKNFFNSFFKRFKQATRIIYHEVI